MADSIRRHLGPSAHPFTSRAPAPKRRAGRRLHALPSRLVQRSVPYQAAAASAARRSWTRRKEIVNTFVHAGDLLAVVHGRDRRRSPTTNSSRWPRTSRERRPATSTSAGTVHGDIDFPTERRRSRADTTGRDDWCKKLIDPPAPSLRPTRRAGRRDAVEQCAWTSRTAAAGRSGQAHRRRLHQAGFIIGTSATRPRPTSTTTGDPRAHRHDVRRCKVRSALGSAKSRGRARTVAVTHVGVPAPRRRAT